MYQRTLPPLERVGILLAQVRLAARDGGYAAAREAAEQLWDEAGCAGIALDPTVVAELRAIPGVRLAEQPRPQAGARSDGAMERFWLGMFGYGRISGLAGPDPAAARAAFEGTILGTARGTGWPPVPTVGRWPGRLAQRRELKYHHESADYFHRMPWRAAWEYLDAGLGPLFPQAEQAAKRAPKRDDRVWDYTFAAPGFHLVALGTDSRTQTTLVVDWAGPPDLAAELDALAARYRGLRDRRPG